MSELLDFYQQQAIAACSNVPWLARLKTDAITDFRRLGFPTRHDENWKYTAVDSFMQQRFSPLQPSTALISATDIPGGADVLLVNGQVMDLDGLTARLPMGVVVLSLAQAVNDHPDKVQAWLGQALDHEHAFQALNTAMLDSGLFIYIPAGLRMSTPLVVRHWGFAHQATYIRHVVVAEAGSEITLIEDYQGEADGSYVTNTITEVYAAADSTVSHYKLQRESKAAYHFGHLSVMQAAHSEVNSHLLNLGGKLVRSDINIRLTEPQAHCLMNGVYAPGEGQHMDHHTCVFHEAPDCQSAQDYKGLLTGHSRAVFNGKVVVEQGAQHTQAKQQNKNLLLSTHAEIDTKPQLDIFADDVICTHGATVGQLDEEALFYLATRGIDRAEASGYLIQAFAADNWRAMQHEALAEWMSGLIPIRDR